VSNSLIGIGLSGLRAAQLGLATAGHNISNASTPGHTRQEIVQSAAAARFTGSGYIGQGVNVDSVRREYSSFLDGQVHQAQSQTNLLQTQYTAIKAVDNLLANANVGLSPALDSFFGAAQDLSLRPADSASRQSFLSASQSLVARFRDLDNRLADSRADANERIRSTVDVVNRYAEQIARLNEKIVLASQQDTRAPAPNDLLDQRDQLLRELNKEVGAGTIQRSDGGVDVFLGNGQALVTGDRVFKLTATEGAFDPRDVEVGIETAASVVKLRSTDLGGGNLGAYFSFRDGALSGAQNAIGRIALTLSAAMNAQHKLGQDRAGNAGGDFFSAGRPEAAAASSNSGTAQLSVSVADASVLAASDYRVKFDGGNFIVTRTADNLVRSYASLPQTVDGLQIGLASGTATSGDMFEIRAVRGAAASLSLAVRSADEVAAAAPIAARANAANRGTATVSAGDVVGPLRDPNLRQPVSITFTSPTTFNVSGTGTGNPTGLSYTPGAPISYNGWTLAIEGAPAAGDSFTVGANVNGVGDNRNALKLARLQTDALLEGGAATLQGAYARLTADIGSRTRELQVGGDAQESLLTATETAQQAVSGVNLDEEAAKLIRYQQAYQAAGKVISVAQTLFDEILNIGR
jgi:flagellar hook-associated protein 1